MIEQAAPVRPVMVLAQLAAVWVAGLVAIVTSGFLLVLAVLLRFPLLLVPPLALLLVLFCVAGMLTKDAARLTRRAGPRLLWASIITLVGTLLIAFGQAVSEAAGDPGAAWIGVVLLTLPFPLVAALLVRPWPVRAVGAVLLGGAMVLASWLPGATMPHDDVQSRLAHAGLSRELAITTSIPGYDVDSISHEDGALVTRFHPIKGTGANIAVFATPAGPDDLDRQIKTEHAYLLRQDVVEVHAVSLEPVPPDPLREATNGLRPASDAELNAILPAAPGTRDRDVWSQFVALLGRLVP